MRTAALVGTMLLALGAAGGVTAARHASQSRAAFADADDFGMTISGARLYARQCAGCHGRRLQGQPFWQVVDQDAGRRAPALDETGRAWLHGDDDLIRMIEYGRYSPAEAGAASHMPAFASRLDRRSVLSVLAFLKVRWPLGTRVAQALRNPGGEGMPVRATTADWTFPGTCVQRAAVASAGKR